MPHGARHLKSRTGATGRSEPVERRMQVSSLARQAAHPPAVTGSSGITCRRLSQRQIMRGVSLASRFLFAICPKLLERELSHRLEHHEAVLASVYLHDLQQTLVYQCSQHPERLVGVG